MIASAFDSRTFRTVLGHYPTGVCVVTAAGSDGGRHGLVVGSFTAISLDPPLVGFFPDKRSTSWVSIRSTGRFCANVLGADQIDLCHRFAAKGADKFQDLAHDVSPSGQPLLREAVAWIECAIDREIEIGDHWLVVGAVEALAARDGGDPLLFFKGGYHRAGPVDRTRDARSPTG